MTEDAVLKPGQKIKAIMNLDDARRIIEKFYGLPIKSVTELNAYDDRNFHVLCDDQSVTDNPYVSSISQDGYVLKIINCIESKKTDFIEAQNDILSFLDKKGIRCTIPVKQKNGSYYSMEIFESTGEKHAIRLLTYCRGDILKKVPISKELLNNVGSFAANLDNTFKGFSHPAYDKQTTLWTMPAVPKIRDFIFALTDKNEINIIEQIVSNFEQKVLTIVNNLEKGIIHGDLNEFNIIISSNNKTVGAVIDFGDSHKNCYIFELAVCVCYMMVQAKNIEMAKYVIEGYQQIRQLTQQEKGILKLCVCARLAQCIVVGSYSFQREPENLYFIQDHPVKWQLLKKLWPMDDVEVMKIWGI